MVAKIGKSLRAILKNKGSGKSIPPKSPSPLPTPTKAKAPCHSEEEIRDDVSEMTEPTLSTTGTPPKLALIPPLPENEKAVVCLQALWRGRVARKKYKIMRYYHGLDKSLSTKSAPSSKASPDDDSSVGSIFTAISRPSTKYASKLPQKMNGPNIAQTASHPEKNDAGDALGIVEVQSEAESTNSFRPTSTTTIYVQRKNGRMMPVDEMATAPSTPSSHSSPPPKPVMATATSSYSSPSLTLEAIKELPKSKASLRPHTKKTKKTKKPVVAPIEVILDPNESENAKNSAAIAKKALLLRKTDYFAYLNALLKAHAAEDILSKSGGIESIINELLCFLAMKALGKRPVPSVKIHRAWRVLVQTRPLAYIEMCKAMGASAGLDIDDNGFAVDDESFDPDMGQKDSLKSIQADMIEERYESTRTTYAALFQSQPPSEFWPSSFDVVVEQVSENHLEFLNEDNLPKKLPKFLPQDDLSCGNGSDAISVGSSVGSDDISLKSMDAADLLDELQYLAKENGIDIANLSYDSIVNDVQRMRLWVDNTFFAPLPRNSHTKKKGNQRKGIERKTSNKRVSKCIQKGA